MRSRRLLALATLLCLVGLMLGVAHGAKPRSLPFSKRSVFNYFRQVEDARRGIRENLKPEAFKERICRLYAEVLQRSGYDFEASVQNAVQFAEKGRRRLDDPRFLFLAGVFQIHPDVFLKLGLIAKPTRDAVVNYLSS